MSNLLNDFLGQDQYQILPRDQIRPDPNQDRRDWDSPDRVEHLQAMAAGMANIVDGKPFGVREPLIVVKVGHNDYMIHAGETRWRAAGIAGIDRLPCLVRSPKTGAATLSLEALVTNVQRNGLTTWELAGALQKRLDGDESASIPPMSYADLTSALDRSKSWISKYTAVLKMPEDIQALCRDRVVENVDTLRNLSTLDDEGRARAIEEIRGGTNANNLVREHIKERKPRQGNSGEATTKEDNSARESDRIQLALDRAQAIQLLQRLGVNPTETDATTLREQLMAQITGVGNDGGQSRPT